MNQEASQLLRLADDHALLLPSGLTGLSKDEIETAIDHAIQAIILAAAAIEAQVNMTIAEPLCYLAPVEARSYFADMFRQAARAPIREKLEFLLRNRQGLALSKTEKAELQAVFAARNAIMHSTPEYMEYPATEQHTRGLPQEVLESLGGVLSVLKTGSRSTEMFNQARQACRVARRFLEQVKRSKPFKKTGTSIAHGRRDR